MGGKTPWGISRVTIFTVFIAIILFHYTSWNAFAIEGSLPKLEQSCVTDKCHSTMGKGKFVHGPVAAGDCTICHIPEGNHKFKSINNVGELCTQCHEKFDTKQVVHPPVKEGKCTGCHDAHQSPYKFQLRATGADLCFLCHDRSIVGGKFVHGPAAVGSCGMCHQAHQSDFPKLLMAKGNQVCFECHTDKAEDLKKKKFIHAPVEEACVNCHSPHSGNYKFNLSSDGSKDLCLTCHTDKTKELEVATVKHKGLETEKKCLACHDPHVSDYAKQLKKQPAVLCLGCHDREYKSPAGHLMNMKEFLAENSEHHGPIKQNDCTGCHNPHGSANYRILRENFPALFYAGYDPDNYKLCFMCHEKTLASEERTTTLTSFRDGDRNLHYLHVNKSEKGRTCRACHDAHATNNAKHIRNSVPFNKWNLPINFVKNVTGGQCSPGCHKMVIYVRNKPVVNK